MTALLRNNMHYRIALINGENMCTVGKLKTPAMDDGWALLVILSLSNPHLLE